MSVGGGGVYRKRGLGLLKSYYLFCPFENESTCHDNYIRVLNKRILIIELVIDFFGGGIKSSLVRIIVVIKYVK